MTRLSGRPWALQGRFVPLGLLLRLGPGFRLFFVACPLRFAATVRANSAMCWDSWAGLSPRCERPPRRSRSALDLLEDNRSEWAWAMSNLSSALYGLGSRTRGCRAARRGCGRTGRRPYPPVLRSLLYLGLDGADSCTTSHARVRRRSSGRMRGGCPTCEVS